MRRAGHEGVCAGRDWEEEEEEKAPFWRCPLVAIMQEMMVLGRATTATSKSWQHRRERPDRTMSAWFGSGLNAGAVLSRPK